MVYYKEETLVEPVCVHTCACMCMCVCGGYSLCVYTLKSMSECVNVACVHYVCGYRCACVYVCMCVDLFSFKSERQVKFSLLVPSIIYSQWHWLYQAHTDNMNTLNLSQVARRNFTVFKNLLVLWIKKSPICRGNWEMYPNMHPGTKTTPEASPGSLQCSIWLSSALSVLFSPSQVSVSLANWCSPDSPLVPQTISCDEHWFFSQIISMQFQLPNI